MILSFDPAVKKMGYSILEIENKNIIKCGIINVYDRNMVKMAKKLIKELRKCFIETDDINTLTYVVVEQQPRINSKAKFIEHLLVGFFVSFDKVIVKVVKAVRKFNYKEGNGQLVFDYTKLRGKSKYRQRKKVIQNYVWQCYNRNDLTFDVCDSIMQSLEFLQSV